MSYYPPPQAYGAPPPGPYYNQPYGQQPMGAYPPGAYPPGAYPPGAYAQPYPGAYPPQGVVVVEQVPVMQPAVVVADPAGAVCCEMCACCACFFALFECCLCCCSN